MSYTCKMLSRVPGTPALKKCQLLLQGWDSKFLRGRGDRLTCYAGNQQCLKHEGTHYLFCTEQPK